MQKWTVVVAVGVLTLSLASSASAQTRRRTNTQEGYPAGQYQQDQYQQDQYQQRQPQQAQYRQGQYQQGQYQQGQPRTAGRSERAAGPMQGATLTDQQLASWLLVGNRAEIQLARVAQEHADCDEVKEFAKQMVDEHSQMVEKLQRFAGMGRSTQADGQYGQQASQSGGLNFLRLKQQLGQQCVASAQQELEQKEGAEFDKCYIGMQLAAHMEMLNTLKVFSRYASPQLDQVIEEGEQTTEEHLGKAKELIKNLERKGEGDKSHASSENSSSSRDRSSISNRSSDSGRD